MATSSHLRVICWLMMAMSPSKLFTQPAILELHDTTITATASFEARHHLSAGRNFVVTQSGDVTFLAGGSISLTPGIVIIHGGRLRAITDPVLEAVRPIEHDIPTEFRLEQNFPNPFNPSTRIQFALKEKSRVLPTVFNLLGQMVATLVNEELTAGVYEVRYSPNTLVTGVYIYRITTTGFTESRSMLLLK